MRRLQFPRSAYNNISATGVIIAVVTGVMFLFSFAIQFFQAEVNPYVGILLYMVLPAAMLGGLVLIPIGMWKTKRRIKREGQVLPPAWPKVDLNRKQHRNAFFTFVIGTAIFLIVGITAAYKGYHHTESVTFCGETCHTVMKPEFVAYQNSPHARVACVDCHVGSGAGWYAKSKLDGLYQVYATARDIYPRPIPTPIESLRPAAETCEECHWPQKFWASQQKRFDHYMYDEENTHWPIDLLLKTGGGDPNIGNAQGIHWHMNISTTVEYIARDHERLDIPWIRTTNRATGEVTIYQNEEDPLTEEEIAATTPRIMDCMDCHNRPSHNYHSPDFLVDRALAAGTVDVSLPEIKLAGVEAMDQDYETEAEAMEGIDAYVREFYEEDYPDVYAERGSDIERSIAALQYQFKTSIFPEMKVKWSEYPDNIGHFSNPGCMRCHEGNHVSQDGKVVTRSCSACHTILSQGSGERHQWATSLDGLEFLHPEDIDEEWRESGCYECHEGVQP